jgi:hypothetical protein
MLFYMLLSVNSMNITEMIKGYLSAAYRGTTFQHFMLFVNPAEKYSILAATAIVILPLAAIFCRDRKLLLSRRPFIPLIMLVAGGYGYISNSDYYMDLTFVLFAEIFLVAELHSSNASSVNGPIVSMPPGLNRYLAWVCVVLTASGIAQGACREHVKTAGYPLFFEYDGDKYVEDEGYYDGWGYHPLPQQPGAEHQGFFKGVHCGRIFHELLQEEETVLRQAPPSSAIWFGPRLQWGYAAFNKPSPRNQPVWWEPGLSFPAVEEGVYFDRFLASRFNVLILFKNDLSHYSEDEKQRIMAQYDVDQSMQVLTILRLKK